MHRGQYRHFTKPLGTHFSLTLFRNYSPSDPPAVGPSYCVPVPVRVLMITIVNKLEYSLYARHESKNFQCH